MRAVERYKDFRILSKNKHYYLYRKDRLLGRYYALRFVIARIAFLAGKDGGKAIMDLERRFASRLNREARK